MFRYIIGAVLASFVVMMIAGALYYNHITKSRLVTMQGAGELVLMDELSLWHTGLQNSGIAYDGFEPIRVRRENSEYYHRTDRVVNDADADMGGFAAYGTRYGQIMLTDNDGSLLYLPRLVDYDVQDILKISLRSGSAAGAWQIAVRPNADQVAFVNAQSAGITITENGDWENVSIPFSALTYEAAPQVEMTKPDWRNPDYLLAQHTPSSDYLFGIGLALIGGQAGESLYIDRMVLEKPVQTPTDHLVGRLLFPSVTQVDDLPPLRRAYVILHSDTGTRRAKVSRKGMFKVDITAGSQILEIRAEGDDRILTPMTGRFMEVGTYMPELLMAAADPILRHTPKSGTEDQAVNANEALYVYEERFGPRMEPNHNFLVQALTNNEPVMAAELVTNRFGYIDRDRRAENPDNAYRVMVLGECHHMGVHIAQADGWWNQAEAIANMKSSRPIEVISGSFNYSSFTSSWPIFRDYGAELNPDLVLIPMIDPGVLNLTVEEYMRDWLGAGEGHRVAYQFEFDDNGKIVHKPNDPDWQLHRDAVSPEDHKRIRAQYVSTPYVHADPAEIPQWVHDNIKLSTASLAEFAKLAKERGTRVGIVYISNYGSSRKTIFNEGSKTFDPNLFRTVMKDMADGSGLEFIDLSYDIHMKLRGADEGRIFYANNGHMTPYGHYRYGQAMGNLLSNWMNADK